MSMTAVAVRPVCRHCQTEIESKTAWLTKDECYECWIEPYCQASALEDYRQRLADGTLPKNYIGC